MRWDPTKGDYIIATLLPFDKVFSGDSSAKVNNGKLTINLGEPKPAYLEDFSQFIENGYTVTPRKAKGYFLFAEMGDGQGICTHDGIYDLIIINGFFEVGLVYVDIDVTLQGTEGTFTLKKGWNFGYGYESFQTPLPSDYKFYVKDTSWF